MISDDQRCHCFNDGNGTGNYACVVTAFAFHDDRVTGTGDGLLVGH